MQLLSDRTLFDALFIYFECRATWKVVRSCFIRPIKCRPWFKFWRPSIAVVTFSPPKNNWIKLKLNFLVLKIDQRIVGHFGSRAPYFFLLAKWIVAMFCARNAATTLRPWLPKKKTGINGRQNEEISFGMVVAWSTKVEQWPPIRKWFEINWIKFMCFLKIVIICLWNKLWIRNNFKN